MTPTPDKSVAKAHLDAFFERFEEDYPGAQIEISHGYPGKPLPIASKLFPNTGEGREAAADFAIKTTVERETAIFFGVGLRRPGLVLGPKDRARKEDVIGLPALFADFDEPGAAEKAKELYEREAIVPSHVVVTGTVPETRAQYFWQLDELIEDVTEAEERLAGIAVRFDFLTDVKVLTFERVMRLAGTLSWPKPGKTGRILEATRLVPPKKAPKGLRSIEWADDVFGRKDVKEARKGRDTEPGADLLSHTPAPGGLAAQATPYAPPAHCPPPMAPANPYAAPGASGEITRNAAGQVVDGRDFYARDLILATIREMTAEAGTWPDADSLFRRVYPTWVRSVVPRSSAATIEDALEKDNRGARFLRDKVEWNVRQAHEGRLPQMPTPAHARAIHEQKQAARVLTGGASFGTAAGPGFGVASGAGAVPGAVIAGGPATSIRRRAAHVFTGGANIPRRSWLYGRHLARRYVSATVAPGGVGKTSLIYAEALSMASGRNLLGVRVDKPLRVFSWNGEDDLDEVERRFEAIGKLYRITPEDVQDRIIFESGREAELKLGFAGQGGQVLLNEALIADLAAYFREREVDVVQIDPFVSSHSVNENDNNAIDAIVKAWGRVAHMANLAVELVHHTKKVDKTHGSNTVEDGRGASALLAAVRSARVLNRMSETEADTLGIEESERWRYFRVDSGKSSMSPPAEVALWRELVSIDLPNGSDVEPGDSVGAVKPWEPPGAFDGLTAADADRVARALRAAFEAGEDVRLSEKSPAWVGLRIGELLGFDATSKGGKARAKGLLRGWLDSGVLKVAVGQNHARQAVEMVTAGGEF